MANEDMVRLIVAQKNGDDKYRYREKMVPADRVQEEIEAIQSTETEEK